MATMAPAKDAAVRGKQARKEVTRSSHRDWAPAADRPRPQDVLAEQDVSRVPELVPIRHGRMLVSAFTFYRGAAAIMAGDLGRTPNSGLEAQLCGDAHLSNFGVFEAPDRRLVFDLNDFDETLRGPFEWDVKRMAVSFAVAGRDRGFDEEDRRAVDRGFGARVPPRNARLRGNARDRGLVRAPRARRVPAALELEHRQEAHHGAREGDGEGPQQGQPARPGPA